MQQSWMDTARKGAITGVVAGAAAAYVFGESGSTTLMGVRMPTAVAIGAANGAASVAADMAHDYVLPHIPQSQKWGQIESAALGIGTAGASTTLILNGQQIGNERGMRAFLLGGASYMVGGYIDNTLFGASAYSAPYASF